MRDAFDQWANANRARIVARLSDYIAIDTVSPNEERAYDFLTDYLEGVGFEIWQEPLHPATFDHPERCPPGLSLITPSRSNLRGRLGGQVGPAVLVSSHVDVVPLGPTWRGGFVPREENGAVVGRGACDTKGNLVMFAEALRFLRDAGIGLTRRIEWDGVIEEEIGGNGALSAVMHPRPGVSGAIILEPTSLQCFRGHRGCLGFSVSVTGRGAHIGAGVSSVGPIQVASELVGALSELEAEFNREALTEPAFGQWARPVQVNVGRIEGGEWHGSAANNCTVKVNAGFPTSYDLARTAARIESLVGASCGGRLPYELQFDGIRNEAYLSSGDAPFIREFAEAVRGAGVSPGPVGAWKVSCDARLYARHLGLPTLVFGAGALEHAHADNERLSIDEMFAGMFALSCYFSQASVW